MKIAIIGAGLAGLSFALTLEKHGHSADIFEKQKEIGFDIKLAQLMTPILHGPVDNMIQFLSENHDIHLKPTTNIQKIHVHSPNESAFAEGKLGFVNMRGNHKEAYEKQLAEQLVSSRIYCNHHVTYQEISKEYSHVVLASGEPLDTEQIQPFKVEFTSTFAGATVKGNFIRNEVHTWFDTELAPKGLVYFLPHSETQASLVLVYPQYDEKMVQNKERLWTEAVNRASKTLNQTLTIEENFSIRDYVVGKCDYPRIGNTFFAGNCFGAIKPFLGFGQTGSILSGIYAAQDICGLGDYEKLCKPLYKDYQDSLALRKTVESLNNDQFDLVTKALRVKAIESIVTGRHKKTLKILSQFLKPFTK
ncbi:NAD(P)-binding protein [Halobacillus mangrovi]|uniref:NAD(P)/FAD-dependent oxidoreductase n=1 Tax=Halobacillus mangrovi TaxID=402384 RepID=UPI003D965FEB